jgi:hypothetical protein
MSTRTDYTDDEWKTLTNAWEDVAAAVITAGSPSFVGTFGEAKATVEVVKDAAKQSASSDLMKAILADVATDKKPDIETKGGPGAVMSRGLEACRQVSAILAAKATPEEATEVKTWLYDVAQDVANAGKEGGFLGIGSTRLSDAEKGVLGELATALGVPAVT